MLSSDWLQVLPNKSDAVEFGVLMHARAVPQHAAGQPQVSRGLLKRTEFPIYARDI